MTKTALIVDDDPISLCVISDLLESRGWTTRRAMSVEESLAFVVHEHDFDAFVIDDHLPDGDFTEILAAWRKGGKPWPWIIRASSADAPAPVAARWNMFVVKPWTSASVERLLKTLETEVRTLHGLIIHDERALRDLHLLFDREACEKAFAKHPRLWFRIRDGVGRRLPALLRDIGESYERRDRLTFRHLAHEISGMFKMLRSQALAVRASELEKRADTAKWEDLLSDLRLLKANLPELLVHLDDFGRHFAVSRDLQ